MIGSIDFDFTYSSTCPCSTDLSIHAMDTRQIYAVPHSQRSIARISIEIDDIVWIEDIQKMCQNALKTETLVFCKREDEQAFAELNAQHTKFVEDAVRLLYEELSANQKILDFKIMASHNESLHSHNAIAVMVKGIVGGFNADTSYSDMQSLVY